MDIKKEYTRIRKNLQAQVRSLKKRGYNVPDNYVPKIPKKITQASVRRLEKAQADIPRKITYGEPPVSYGRGRDIEREAAARKGQETKKRKKKKPEEVVLVEHRSHVYDNIQDLEIPEAESIYTEDYVLHMQGAEPHSDKVPNKTTEGGMMYYEKINLRAAVAKKILAELNMDINYPFKRTLQVNMNKDAQRITEMMDAYLYGYMVYGYTWKSTANFIYDIRNMLSASAAEKMRNADEEEYIYDVMYDEE